MRFTVFVVVLLAISGLPGRSMVDCANASTQLELNERASRGATRARQRMNRALAKVLEERGEQDRAAVDAAQRAWEAYAKAQIEALYPGCDKSAACGSVNPMCRAIAASRLLRVRTSELQGMLEKHQREGEVCAPQSADDER